MWCGVRSECCRVVWCGVRSECCRVVWCGVTPTSMWRTPISLTTNANRSPSPIEDIEMNFQLAKCQQKSTYFFNKIGSSFEQKDQYDWMDKPSKCQQIKNRGLSQTKEVPKMSQEVLKTGHLQLDQQQLHSILELVGVAVDVVVGVMVVGVLIVGVAVSVVVVVVVVVIVVIRVLTCSNHISMVPSLHSNVMTSSTGRLLPQSSLKAPTPLMQAKKLLSKELLSQLDSYLTDDVIIT